MSEHRQTIRRAHTKATLDLITQYVRDGYEYSMHTEHLGLDGNITFTIKDWEAFSEMMKGRGAQPR